jgi:hypothetical protein
MTSTGLTCIKNFRIFGRRSYIYPSQNSTWAHMLFLVYGSPIYEQNIEPKVLNHFERFPRKPNTSVQRKCIVIEKEDDSSLVR